VGGAWASAVGEDAASDIVLLRIRLRNVGPLSALLGRRGPGYCSETTRRWKDHSSSASSAKRFEPVPRFDRTHAQMSGLYSRPPACSTQAQAVAASVQNARVDDGASARADAQPVRHHGPATCSGLACAPPSRRRPRFAPVLSYCKPNDNDPGLR
jgi:hypothetical protein